jgi:hypothetical protein
MPPKHLHLYVGLSPPCTEYSVAKTTGTRKLEEANMIVKKTLGAIQYFNPTLHE